jgi:hypothetical protein
VIESSNPFFIAVCSPESYKPKSSGRRHHEPANIRVKPNVFLRQPSRHSSYDGGHGHSGGNGTNHFIHHPRLQNERQRGGDSSSVAVSTSAGAGVGSAFRNDTIIPNIRDTEQFPSLSSSSTVVNTTKLNFKEMVMKNTTQSDTVVAAVAVAAVTAVSPVAASVSERHSQKPQKTLSVGNIFSSVFYGSGNDGGDDGGDDYEHDVGGSGGGSVISSILVDSCDRKYDNLYGY